MKVIGIVGSPRKGSNTEVMMNHALEAAREAGANVELLSLRDKQITPCQACYSCIKTGQCRIQDDMQPFYAKLLEADGIIIGSPVYFWGVSGQLKVFIDRTGPLAVAHGAMLRHSSTQSGRVTEGLKDKVGGTIVVTARAGATSAVSQIRAFFRVHRMIDYGGAIGYGSAPGDILNDEQGMREAGYMGKAVANTIKRLQS